MILLTWIFHTIFILEGRRSIERQSDLSWTDLSDSEQFKVAWTRGPSELMDTLGDVSATALWLSGLFMGMTLLIGIVRWRLVLQVQGLSLSLLRTAEISLVAHFFNSFLLGSTGGDLLKAYYAARETHHKKTEAVTTVFADRLIGLFSMLLFAGFMMIPNLTLLRNEPRIAAVAWLILAMLLGCGVLVGFAFWSGLSRRLPTARTWLRRLPKGPLLEQSLEACRRFGRPGFLLRTFGLSMVLNLACVLQVFALVRGLDLDIPIVTLCLVVPMIICVSALPITPSGLGVRENLYVWLLAVPGFGVPETRALSLSLLAYAGSLAWSLIGGLVYLTFKQRHAFLEPANADS